MSQDASVTKNSIIGSRKNRPQTAKGVSRIFIENIASKKESSINDSQMESVKLSSRLANVNLT